MLGNWLGVDWSDVLPETPVGVGLEGDLAQLVEKREDLLSYRSREASRALKKDISLPLKDQSQ
jgi:hypothetical protein